MDKYEQLKIELMKMSKEEVIDLLLAIQRDIDGFSSEFKKRTDDPR